jgi:cytochrome c biogenesis protein
MVLAYFSLGLWNTSIVPIEDMNIDGRGNMAERDIVIQCVAKQRKRFFQIVHSCISMKVAMMLLFLLIGVAMAGTVISPQRYDVYHSMGFRLLLTLVCCSTFVCSMRQFTSLCRSGGKQRLASWGTFTVHIAIVLIVLGALYGNLYGFSHEINLPVGKGYEITHDQYDGIAEPFRIHLQDFETRYYADGSVSDWVSHIRIEQDGQEVVSQEVKVNHPLTYNEVSIYQSSFGMAIQTQYLDTTGKVLQEASLGEGRRMILEGQPDMMILPVRYIGGPNPQIWYIVYKDGREYDWGVAPLGSSRFVGTGMIKFLEVQPFSGLLIKYDPGIPLVWLGFILLTLGFFVSLYKRNSNRFYETQDTIPLAWHIKRKKNVVGLNVNKDR